MTQSSGEELLIFDLEIQRIFRWLRALAQRETLPMVEQREHTMMEYATPSLSGIAVFITRPAVTANNFEIKLAIIQMIQQTVQFCGFPNEDPNAHIANFLEICETSNIIGLVMMRSN